MNFYHGLLGFKIIYDKVQNDPKMKLRNAVLMGSHRFKLELVQFYHPKAIKPKIHSIFKIGYNHIGIEVDNVNVVYEMLKEHHVATYGKPVVMKKIGYSFFYAEDPDGNYLEFFQELNPLKHSVLEQ